MLHTEGDAATPSAGHTVQGDTDSPRQRLTTHLAHVDEALRHPVDTLYSASMHPALTELRGMLAEELERLEAEADA